MQRRFENARIAFDLDGTLVDSAPDLVRALNTTITAEGLAAVPLDAVRPMIGRGARALIERAYERDRRAPPEGEAMADLLERFIETYLGDIARLSKPFPGVVNLLDRLHDQGASLSVCTNKRGELANALLQAVDLAWRFDRIVGADQTAAKKPHPGHLIDSLGGPADARCAMVGDSTPDVEAAKAAGVRVFVYAHGYTEKPADTLGADQVFQDFSTLDRLFEAAFSEGA